LSILKVLKLDSSQNTTAMKQWSQIFVYLKKLTYPITVFLQRLLKYMYDEY
jgi:hypothetical protein